MKSPEDVSSTLQGSPSPSKHWLTVEGFEYIDDLTPGAMARVFLYEDRCEQLTQEKPKRQVVVKVLGGFGVTEIAVERFKREANAIASLKHDNVVKFIDFVESPVPYIIMEYCANGSLKDMIEAMRKEKKLLEHSKAAKIVADLALALKVIHANGLFHRDLKPANILFDKNNTPKIGDFGLVKFRDDLSSTQTGMILGTPLYMSPEQAEGNANHAGPATDIYSLGAILYELLTGSPPYDGTARDVLKQVTDPKVEPRHPSSCIPTVPKELESICLKCLAKKPEDRFESAADLAEALSRYVNGSCVSVQPPPHRDSNWILVAAQQLDQETKSSDELWRVPAKLFRDAFVDQALALHNGCVILPRSQFHKCVKSLYARAKSILCTSVPAFRGFWDENNSYGKDLLRCSEVVRNNGGETVRIFLVEDREQYLRNPDLDQAELRNRKAMFQRQRNSGVRAMLASTIDRSGEFSAIQDDFRDAVTRRLEGSLWNSPHSFPEEIELDLGIVDSVCDSVLNLPKKAGELSGGERDLHGIFFRKESPLGGPIYQVYVDLFPRLRSLAKDWEDLL